ncbi:COG1470 family protein [Pyrococcus kukulkanii]|uniref:CARDB domain-containing protein n=1 Tax=Pyrococcus kukulkanii TaxID=1609559 RepID=A0ABV4T7R5_9EURY
MRKALFILVLLILMPFVNAQVGQFESEGKVIGLVNSVTSGEFYLINPLKIKFAHVSIKSVKFFDEEGNEVEDFNIEFQDSIFRFWDPGEKKLVKYSLYAKNVTPGEYVLYIFMWGFTETNQLYLLSVYVPVEVKDKPLIFQDAVSFVKDKPNAKVALSGDIIVVYSHVTNLASVPINVTARAEIVSQSGKVVTWREFNQSMNPGDNLIRFELKLPDPLRPGVYELRYRISYERGVYEYSREYWVDIGISFVDMSIEGTNVLQGEDNFAYIVVSSDRSALINVNLTVYAPDYSLENSTKFRIIPGSNIIKLKLPTEKPGRHEVGVKVFYKGFEVGESTGDYLVIGFPTLNSSVKGDSIAVMINNPNAISITATVDYRITWDDGSLVREAKELLLPPGNYTFSIALQRKGAFKYEISLRAFGKEFEVRGAGVIKPPSPTSTTTSFPHSTTTSSSTITTSSESTTSSVTPAAPSPKKGSNWAFLLLLLVLVGIVGISGYYWFNDPKRKRRKRKKPKRKSPLGRK